MNTTRPAAKLIETAEASGLAVRCDGSRVEIVRRGRNAVAIHVYENGTILRADVRADLAASLTASAAAALLRI